MGDENRQVADDRGQYKIIADCNSEPYSGGVLILKPGGRKPKCRTDEHKIVSFHVSTVGMF